MCVGTRDLFLTAEQAIYDLSSRIWHRERICQGKGLTGPTRYQSLFGSSARLRRATSLQRGYGGNEPRN